MDLTEKIDSILQGIMADPKASLPQIRRICGEIDFAKRFIEVRPDLSNEWAPLIIDSVNILEAHGKEGDYEDILASVEDLLAPIGLEAKIYTIHCCGHAHIDMNWTWPWIETIAVSRDTFTTVDKLMDEFSELTFAQSQISIYDAMKRYCPEVFEIIEKRMKEGRWEPTAAMWVESDKNMASGESICRHILYSKLWMRENFGLPFGSIKLAWEGDTFGHPWTLPTILKHGGITRYYHCRPTMSHWLSRWRSPDGSEVIEFCDKGWYNGDSNYSNISANFIDYIKETGFKDFLWIVGIGDHGGGPTRQDLRQFREMAEWPIYPNIKFGSTNDYFDAIEAHLEEIKIFDGELNTVFEGCYTSQSRVKQVNRIAENMLPEAEMISVFAEQFAKLSYPRADLREAWEHILFNQFHDILSGSSGHDAMEEAVARFREAEALAGTIKIRALREIASKIDTTTICDGATQLAYGDTIGHGSGEIRIPGRTSTMSMGVPNSEPVVVFNALPFNRSGMVALKIWDRKWDPDKIVATDDSGVAVPVQVVGYSHYATYQSALNVIFPATDVPSMGYRTYSIRQAESAAEAEGARIVSDNTIENKYLRVEVDANSGAIRHLIDKISGFDYVADGGLMGLLELYSEAPHIMTAWDIGQITRMKPFLKYGKPVAPDDMRYINECGDSLGMVYSHRTSEVGPHRASIRTMHEKGDSWVVIEVALEAESKAVDINVTADWRDVGTPKTGVPMLKMAFHSNLSEAKAIYEIPFGSISRPVNGSEVPALRWADFSGAASDGSPHGFTLINDCKYGFSANGNTLRATLIRSTYDPDPVPEIGMHQMRFSIHPHRGECQISKAMRNASSFAQPMIPIITDIHSGTLPTSGSGCEIEEPNVMLASFKKAEARDAFIIRLYETDGKDTTAHVKLPLEFIDRKKVYEVDILEQPLAQTTASIESDVISVVIPAYGMISLMIE